MTTRQRQRIIDNAIDTSQRPAGMGLGLWTRLDDLTPELLLRALRIASREHMAMNVQIGERASEYLEWYAESGYENPDEDWQDGLRYEIGAHRSSRKRGYVPEALPWQACKIVGVADGDPHIGNDVMFIAVRYAESGACAGYGVKPDGTLHCYWD